MKVTLKQLREYDRQRHATLEYIKTADEATALTFLEAIEKDDREMAPAARALGYELQ